jgi:hypothetical protein
MTLRIAMMVLAGATALSLSTVAYAHNTPCCVPKACPAGKTAVKGASPAAAKCCTNPANAATCTAAPNAGWMCTKDTATNATSIPGREAFAGCVDGEGGVCIGGAISPAGPEGCIGLEATFVTSTAPQGGTEAQCNADAVDACCAHGACE